MQTLFNDPIISNFLATVSPHDRPSTLRELVLLGITVVSTKIHNRQDKENIPYQIPNSNILAEIELLKQKIERLSSIVGQADEGLSRKSPITFQEQNQTAEQIRVKHTNDFHPAEVERITPKVTQTAFPMEGENEQRPRGISRHHLDDSEIRKVLVNPYAVETPQEKKGKKKEKVFEHQQEIDQEALRNMKNLEKEEGTLGRSKKSYPIHAESKIKSLIEKDKMKFKKATTGFDFGKYEYSDDEDYYESTKQLQEEEPQQYSNYVSQNSQLQESSMNVGRGKKERRQWREEREAREAREEEREEEREWSREKSSSDAVSESSSFSKFSMGSQRETGKISMRRK